MQHNAHVVAWLRLMAQPVTERRYSMACYRGKVSRITQLNQLARRGDREGFVWLKRLWRDEFRTGVHYNA